MIPWTEFIIEKTPAHSRDFSRELAGQLYFFYHLHGKSILAHKSYLLVWPGGELFFYSVFFSCEHLFCELVWSRARPICGMR